MSLIEKLAPLVAAGVVVHLTLRKAGDKVQLEILPEADTRKTGIAIPPRAFLGTAQELDAGLEDFLPNYVRSATGLNDQIAETAQVMAQAEEDAKQARANAAKPRTVAPAKAGSSTASAPSKTVKKANPGAGFLDTDDDADDEGGCGAPGACESGAASASGEPAHAGSADGAGDNLFV